MAVGLLDRVQVDDISAQARDVQLGRVLLTVIAAVFWGIGWVAAKSFLAVAWCAVAVRQGWREGRRAAVSHGAA